MENIKAENAGDRRLPPGARRARLWLFVGLAMAVLLIGGALFFAFLRPTQPEQRRQRPSVFMTVTPTLVVMVGIADPPSEVEAPATVEGGVTPTPLPPTPVPPTSTPMLEPACAIITADRVNLRESPAGAVRALANTGLPVLLLVERQEANGIRWAKIRLDSVERWVAEQYVLPVPCR